MEGIGFSNALSPVRRHPGARQNRGGRQRPKRSNLSLDAGRSLSGVDSPAGQPSRNASFLTSSTGEPLAPRHVHRSRKPSRTADPRSPALRAT